MTLVRIPSLKLAAAAVIARDKITRYLLVFESRGDKSAFLRAAGYTLDNADQLLNDLRSQILPLDSVPLEMFTVDSMSNLTYSRIGDFGR